MIIGLSGFSGTGKDTVALELAKLGFVVVSFADPLKRIVRDVFDFSPEHLWGPSHNRNTQYGNYPRPVRRGTDNPGEAFLTPRYALQTLGTEWGRDCYPDIWVEYALRVARRLGENWATRYSPQRGVYTDPLTIPLMREGVVIPDCRFLNELTLLRANDARIVRIRRPGKESPAFNHPSETEQLQLPDSDFDYVLQNDGAVADLPAKVASMLDALRSNA